MSTDETLEILKMVEAGQVTAEEAVTLLAAVGAGEPEDTTLPGASMEEEAWMLTALLQVTEAIAGAGAANDTPEQLLERVVRIVPLLSGVDNCSIALWHDDTQTYIPAASYPA